MSKLKGFHEVELDKPRKLRFDFNAVADAEERLGMGIGAIFSEDRIGFNTLRILFWSGLKWQERNLTIEKVGNILHQVLQEGWEMEDLADALTEGLISGGIISRDEAEGGEEEEVKN